MPVRVQARLWLLLVVYGFAPALPAAELLSSQILHQNGSYTMQVQARLQVSRDAAFAALLDYERLPDLHPSIESVEQSVGAGGEPRLAILTRVCVGLFCRDIHQVQNMFPQPPATLRAEIDPAESDFREGFLSWRLKPLAENTSQLTFSAKVTPKFWVPPVIGPWLIKRKLASEALESAAGVERVARSKAAAGS